VSVGEKLLVLCGLSFSTMLFFGCATASIVKVSDDTYIISKSDHSPGFGQSKALKGEVEAEANQFAAKLNKVAVPVSISSSPAFPLHFASVEYRFRVLEKNDPVAVRAATLPFPQEGNATANLSAQSDKPDDTYNALLKLDELKKRGVITQPEFDAEKKKILDRK
jgi:hypothetical protein